MSELGMEGLRELNDKLKTLERDIARYTAVSAGRKFHEVADVMKNRYDRTSTVAKEYVSSHPGVSALTASLMGMAIGFLVHMLWRKK